MAETYVALLRGINVGGNNKLPMKDLAAMFIASGCDKVQTYIQSGNVIFSTTPDFSKQVSDLITHQIQQQFGYKISVLVRTKEQLGEAIRLNPFIQKGGAEDILHLMFLADLPNPEHLQQLNPRQFAPDEFIIQGQEIYLSLPNGVARTKLNNTYFDTKLKTISTARNWRTVTKLFELMTF